MSDAEFDPGVERAGDIDADTAEPRPGSAPGAEADASGEAADTEAGEASNADVFLDVDAVLAERDQFKDLAMRVQADFENYRKRAAAQQAADVDRATGRLAEALLPVLDAAEAAYVQHPDEVGPLLGVLLGELKKHGLETLELAGQPFDPEVAEAVAHQSIDGGPVVVSEVLRSGYRWRGKTLRPAMVRTQD